MKALVIGFNTEKGQLISNFLVNRGVVVSVADNKPEQQEKEIQGIDTVFNLNPKHRDSLWLMFAMAKPEALIYCEKKEDYIAFRNAILIAVKNKISKIVLVINEEIKELHTLSQLEAQTMINALDIVTKDTSTEWCVVRPNDNLLKEIKRFLLGDREEVV